MTTIRTACFGGALALASACTTSSDAVPCGVAPASALPRAPLPPPLVAPCDAQGWCWENPLPFRDSLGPIWHRPEQTILTSMRGHVLRLRGGAWEAMPALPRPPGENGTPSLFDVWATGAMVYVSGRMGSTGVVWVHDGSDWTTHAFPDGFRPFNLWGTHPDVVMASGNGARVLRGSKWTTTDPPRLSVQGLWGCGDTFYGGMFQGSFYDEETVIARFQSGDWTKTGEVPEQNVQFSAVSGTSHDDLFAVGITNGLGREIAWHFDGRAWTEIDIPDCVGLLDVVALGGGRAFATGLGSGGLSRVWRFDGTTWSVDSEDGFYELGVATPEDVLGRDALNIQQFDGASWFSPFTLPLASTLGASNFTAIFDDGSGVVLVAATDGSVFRFDGASWTELTPPPPVARTPRAMWGVSANDVHVVGDRGLLWRWDGTDWTETTLPPILGTPYLNAVWGSAADHVIAVGDAGQILRFDGTDWVDEERVAQDLVAVWGSGPSDIWAVGDRGLLAHFDGLAWDDSTELPGNPSTISALWGASSNRIFAVGGDSVWQFDGVAWTGPVVLQTPADLTAIWGSGPDDVFAVGTSGAAFHFDGTSWTDVHAEHAWSYRAIAGHGSTVRAVGDLGTVTLRRTGP